MSNRGCHTEIGRAPSSRRRTRTGTYGSTRMSNRGCHTEIGRAPSSRIPRQNQSGPAALASHIGSRT
eukprot:scaffold229444_cov31-Tisochrysis_lutea.AAC.2